MVAFVQSSPKLCTITLKDVLGVIRKEARKVMDAMPFTTERIMELRDLDSRKMLMSVLSRLLSTKRTKVAQARIEERFRAKLCINKKLEAPGSDVVVDCESSSIGGRRGQCSCCYREFNGEVIRFGDDRQGAAEYEAKLIREGLILEHDESRALNSRSIIRRRRRA